MVRHANRTCMSSVMSSILGSTFHPGSKHALGAPWPRKLSTLPDATASCTAQGGQCPGMPGQNTAHGTRKPKTSASSSHQHQLDTMLKQRQTHGKHPSLWQHLIFSNCSSWEMSATMAWASPGKQCLCPRCGVPKAKPHRTCLVQPVRWI